MRIDWERAIIFVKEWETARNAEEKANVSIEKASK